MSKLTTKQRRFVEEYCCDFNATQAALRAGYSKKAAHNIGWENVRKREIQTAIQRRLDDLAMTAEEALKRLTDMARGSLDPFLEPREDGRFYLDLSSDEAQRNVALIKKLKQTETRLQGNAGIERKTEVEIHDAKDALVQLLKIHGKFIERHEHSGGIDVRVVYDDDDGAAEDG